MLTLTALDAETEEPTLRSEYRIDGADRKGRITGLGMGPNVIVGGAVQPGGLTYDDMEVVQANLGSGNDTVTVDYTTNAEDHTTARTADYYTLTILNTGGGDDQVTIDLSEDQDGAFSLNAQNGNDMVNGSESTAPLIIFGWEGEDTITGGAGDDILFGDLGRVDYTNTDGEIVTRLGHSIRPNPVNPPVTSATATTLTDIVTKGGAPFSTEFGGLTGLVVQAISPDGRVQFRRIVANTADTLTIPNDQPWDPIPTVDYFYRVAAVPEDQTDGVLRGPIVAWTIEDTLGAGDSIHAKEGRDLVLGGPGDDEIRAGSGIDIAFGDSGRFDFSRDLVAPEEPAAGDFVRTLLDRIHSHVVDAGGEDEIYGEADADLLVGGYAGDDIFGDDPTSAAETHGADILLGDNAQVDYVDGVIREFFTTDTTEATGGADSMFGKRGCGYHIGRRQWLDG